MFHRVVTPRIETRLYDDRVFEVAHGRALALFDSRYTLLNQSKLGLQQNRLRWVARNGPSKLKSELGIRPVYQRLEDRADADVFHGKPVAREVLGITI
jgi:hypothetical protein